MRETEAGGGVGGYSFPCLSVQKRGQKSTLDHTQEGTNKTPIAVLFLHMDKRLLGNARFHKQLATVLDSLSQSRGTIFS